MKTKNYFSWAVALVALCVSFTANAQLQENQKLINFSLGLGSYYTSGSGFKTTLPPIQASYEVMIKEKLSVGGFIGVSGSKFEQSITDSGITLTSTTKYKFFNLGGMVNYHFVNDEVWNVYVGGRLGYVSNSFKSEYTSNLTNSSEYDDEIKEYFNQNGRKADIKSSGVLFGVNLGARYHVSEKLAIHSELGYGISVFEIGVTYKL